MRRRAASAAALLTQHGFAGPVDMIEGSGGFARAYADGFNPAMIEDGLGEQFLLMDVLVKSHAAAARVAAGIDAMLALRQQHGFSGDDIASMQLGIPKVIQGRLTNPHPVDLQAAQMCLPFSVALASHVPLAKGRIPTLAVADYEAGLGDRRLYEIEERTTIALDDEVEAASNALSTAAKVAVRLRDGRELAKFVPAPKGSAGDPFTAAEHEARFVQELSSRVSDKDCAEIIAMSKDLDRLDPRRLGQMLSGAHSYADTLVGYRGGGWCEIRRREDGGAWTIGFAIGSPRAWSRQPAVLSLEPGRASELTHPGATANVCRLRNR